MHSRKAIPYIILLFFPTHLIAQIGHSVEYQRKLLGDTTTSVGKWPNKIFLSRLVFDDTASFFYNLSQEIRRDPFKERKIYGLKLDNHSWYYKPGKNVLAEGHHLKTAGKHFLVLDTALRFNWVLLSDTKIIEGYTCFASLSVNNKNDSTLAYYTRDIPLHFGPAWYVGLPGLILEVYDQERGWHVKARKIEKKNITTPCLPK